MFRNIFRRIFDEKYGKGTPLMLARYILQRKELISE